MKTQVWGMEPMMTREVTPHVHISEKHVQNTSNSTFHLLKKQKRKKKQLKQFYRVGPVWSYIVHVFILSPEANTSQYRQ